MKLFNNNIVPYTSAEGDKIYPIVVDIKKGIKSGEAISFVTADNQVGVITVDFMDGNSSYSIEGCMVTSTIRRPDGTVLEIPCDIISQSTIEIPLGINGTYQEGVHTFDLKIVRGNGKVIGVPTMSYSVSGSLSSDGVVEGDDRLPVLTMVLDNAQDKLTRLDKAIAGATNDLEVKEARDGEVTLNARLERDLAKGKIHFVDVEGSNIATESQEGYLENIEIYGNTWQDSENLADIRSVGTKVDGQELYEIPVLSYGKNLFDGSILSKADNSFDFSVPVHICEGKYRISFTSNVSYSGNSVYLKAVNPSYSRFLGTVTNYNGRVSGNLTINADDMNVIKSSTKGLRFSIYRGDGISDIPTDILITQSDDLSYEPYQEDKLTILSPVQLEKVGDVADRIICKDGVWGVEKNIYTITSGVFYKSTPNMWYVSESKCPAWVSKNSWNKIENKIMCNYYSEIATYGEVESGVGIFIDHKGTHPNIIIGTGDETITSLPEDLEVKYQLVQPQFIPLPHDQQIKLRTFADRTHIHFDTEIEPTIKAQVPKSLGATVNTHTSQIDNLNKELGRVKKLEESTVSTVTTNKAFTIVAETTQGYFEDVMVEGKTLVNLATLKEKFVIRANSEATYTAWFNPKQNLKAGNVYTLIYTSENVNETVNTLKCRQFGIGTTLVWKHNTLPANKGNGTFMFTLEPTEDYTNIGFYFDRNFDDTTSTATISNVIILEGDHTDKDISFFEGLKSVGQGTDEVEISSQNKNILPIEELKKYIGNGLVSEGLTFNVTNNNKIIVNGTSNNFWDFRPINLSWTPKFFKYINSLPIGTSIRLNNNLGLNNYWAVTRNGTVNYLGNTITIQQGDSDINGFVRIPQGYSFENNQELQLQIEFGTNATNYVTPKIHKKEILYFNPTTQSWEKPILREWDSIEKHSDGKYYYHKRSGEVVLNGSEHWSYPVSQDGDNTILFYSRISDSKINQNYPICDMFSGTYLNIWEPATDIEGILINHNKDCILRLNKTKLPTQDATGFKQWLQANNVTVVYQLAKEEVFECTNLDLITYSGETNLIVNSGAIQPKITLKVLSNVSNVIKLLQEKVSVLENKFIEGLKQVLSGDMMSLAHLLYPEDFEHEIQTLEL